MEAFSLSNIRNKLPQSLPTRETITKWCIGSTVASIATITILIIYAGRTYKKQIASIPSEKELEKLDGEYFKRPSDSKKLEYFTINGGSGKPAIILFHGSMGTGYMFSHWKRNIVKQILQKYNIQLICPSMPGHGASEQLNELNANKALKIISNDIENLLHTLDILEIYTMGVSYGCEPAFYLAQYLLQKDSNITIKGIASLCGAPWSTKTFNNTENRELSFVSQMIANLMMKPSLLPFMAKFIIKPMIGLMTAEQIISSSNDDYFKENRDIAELMEFDLKRTGDHFLDGFVMPTIYFTQRTNDINTDYAYFNDKKNIRINYHYGDKDTDVPVNSRKYIFDKISHGQYYQYEGGHAAVPLVIAIQKMLEQK